jgi:murein DD-endopeptidase MepM/ murein hydrolase activator NlpD
MSDHFFNFLKFVNLSSISKFQIREYLSFKQFSLTLLVIITLTGQLGSLLVAVRAESPVPEPESLVEPEVVSETTDETIVGQSNSSSEGENQSSQTPLKPVSPVFEQGQTEDLGQGMRRLYFGYNNPNSTIVEINYGDVNKFTPGPEDRGQPTSFNPGRAYKYFYLDVECDSGNHVWTLDGRTATGSVECVGGSVKEEAEEEFVFDFAATTPSLKFLKPIDLTDNKAIINTAGCYYVSKISHEGEGGKLHALVDSLDTLIHQEYNDIPNYTYLGYYETSDELILKILPNFKHSPDQILSTDPNLVKVKQLGVDIFRFYFEDWPEELGGDNDFNDLVLEVKRGECEKLEDKYQVAIAPDDESLIFTTEDQIALISYVANDENEVFVSNEGNQILAIQFLDQDLQPEVLSVLPENGGLELCSQDNCKYPDNVLGNPDLQVLDDTWYAYNGMPYTRILDLPDDGLYQRTIRVVYKDGSLKETTQAIIKDSTAPQTNNLAAKETKLALKNQETKIISDITFSLFDQGLNSGLNSAILSGQIQDQNLEYKLSTSNQDFEALDWNNTLHAQEVTTNLSWTLNSEEFDKLKNGESIELDYYLQTKDKLGNISGIQEGSLTYQLADLELQINYLSDTVRELSAQEQQELGLAVDQLDVFYTSRAEYDLDISGQLINKLKVSDSDDLDSLDWQEVDLSSQDYQAQLNSLFNSEYDFSLESGYPKIGVFELCFQVKDVFDRASGIQCKPLELTYSPDPIYDPKGPFADQPVSCQNPYGWIEIKDLRTETTKTFSVPKQIQETQIDGQTVYQIPFYNQSGEIEYQNISADELVVNPNPGDNPEYFDTTVCSFTDKIHYQNPDNPSLGWIDVDNYIYQLSPDTPERQQGYMYRNGSQLSGNDFTVYFGQTAGDGFWFFSDELDYKVNAITIGGQALAPNSPSVRNNSITYPEILPGVDLQYIVHSTGVSKEFVIKNEQGRSHDLTEIVFDFVSSRKLVPSNCEVVDEGCKITFEGAETIFMTPPWTTDAQGLDVVLEEYIINNDSTKLSVYPDQDYLLSPDRTFPIRIDPNIVHLGSGGDSFARQYHSWPQGGPTSGTRHMLAVGTQVKDSFDGGYIGYSETFMRFVLPSHVKNSGIASSHLRLRHYNTWPGRGNFNAGIYNTGDFNEWNLNWWNKPGFGSRYGHISFGTFNASCWDGCHREAEDRWSSNIAGLVNDSKSSGLALIGLKSDPGNTSAIFCSKEGRDIYHPCVDGADGPLLQITLNNAPTPPKAESPDGEEFIGNCDLSVTPTTGNCQVRPSVNFTVSNINGGDGDAGWYNLELVDRFLDQDFRYQGGGYIGPVTKHTRSQPILNGIYNWGSRNQDTHHAVSHLSATKETVVDTQSPVQMEDLVVDSVSEDGQIEFDIPKYSDNLLTKFQIKGKNTNLAVDASSRSHGANVYLHTAHNGLQQKWSMDASGQIRGLATRCLEYQISTGNVVLGTCVDGAWNQRWEHTEAGELRVKGSNLCLDGMYFQNNNNLYIHPCHGGGNQKFELVDVTLKRVRLKDTDLSIDLSGSYYSSGEEYIHAWPSHLGDNQKWLFVKTPLENVYQLRGRGNRCLQSTQPEDGKPAGGAACSGDNRQKWIVDGDRIKPFNNPSLCVDTKYFTGTSNQVYLSNCSDSPGQKWVVENSLNNMYPDHQFSYYVQVATDDQFQDVFYEGWQASTQFQLACVYDETGWIVPGDELDDTNQIPRTCLSDQTTYYIRVKAKDRRHSLDPNALNRGNISRWSEINSIFVDTSKPLVENLSIDNQRISPNNLSSSDILDTSTISFEFSEPNFDLATVQILDAGGSVVRTVSECEIGGQNKECNQSNLNYVYDDTLDQEDLANFQLVSFVFDGTDDFGSPLPDGLYEVRPLAYDNEGVSNDLVESEVIIDNSPATISVTNPNFSFVKNQVNITGQIAGLNQASREDGDFSKLEIKKIDLDGTGNDSTGFDWKDISLGMTVESSPGDWVWDETLFSLAENLDPGINRFAFRSTDLAGNQISVLGNYLDGNDQTVSYLDLYNDTTALEFLDIQPSGQLQTVDLNGDQVYKPELRFRLVDDSLDLDLAAQGFDSGNFSSYDLSLFYSSFGSSNWVEFPLIKDGVDISASPAILETNLGCQISVDPSYSSSSQVVDCGLGLAELSLPGDYYIAIKATDKAGNEVCNFDFSNYLSDTTIDCSGSIQNPTPGFDPEVTFSIPQTSLTTDVVITSPENNYLTNRGAINVVGLAPASTPAETWQVDICVDALTVPEVSNCDLTVSTNTDSTGVFVAAIALPQTTNQFILTASGGSTAGGTTGDSNQVLVNLDTTGPFKSVAAVPSFYGVNTQAEIDQFLSGLLTIEELRTIQLRSEVTSGTQAVDLDFLNYDNLSLIPGTDPATGYPDIYNPDGRIAIINDTTETEFKWNPNASDQIKQDWSNQVFDGSEIQPEAKCEGQVGDSCMWIYNYPTPFWFGGGMYEIRFRGYKNETIQDLTRAVAITNQTISAPRLLRVEKLDSTNQVTDKAQAVGSSFYTNTNIVRLTGVSDPGSVVSIDFGQGVDSVTVPDSGIWNMDITLPNVDGGYTLNLESALNNLVQPALEDYTLVLDTVLPKVTGVETTNLSNSNAINPWLLTGDQIQFAINTDEPLLDGSVFGELGFREDLYRIENGLETSDSCQDLQNCSQDQWMTRDFRGRLTILRPLQGMYYPYIKLTDLAGNTIFYSNNSNIQNINIDPFDGGLEDSQAKEFIDATTVIQNLNYPYSHQSRGLSLDFRLFIDNQKPLKEELIIDGWGNRLNGVYAGKKQDLNNPKLYLDDNQDVFEADRLLTDKEYVDNENCTITDNSFWEVYDPLETTADGCPVSPAYVTKQNEAVITGLTEKNQKLTLTIQTGRTISDQTETISTQTKQIIVPNDQCYSYQTHPELYPELAGIANIFPGQMIPGIHTDLISRGGIITQFSDKCKWTYTHQLNDDGLSPQGVPHNWYKFSYHIMDLAGNTPVETENAPGVGDPQNSDDLGGKTIESRSVTIYHDTDDPDDYQISNLKDENHSPVIDFPTNSITRSLQIIASQLGERAADVEYQIKQSKLESSETNQLQFTLEPDNILGSNNYLTQNSYAGTSETTLPLGADQNLLASIQDRDDTKISECTKISSQTINRRIGTCNDGIYTISSRETDTAGNAGNWIERSIERDTVRPDTPSVVAGKTGDIFQEYLTLDIEGEAGTKAEIKISGYRDFNSPTSQAAFYNKDFSVALNNDGKYSSSRFISLDCGFVRYQVTVTLTDRAGNISQVSTPQEVLTSDCPRCSTNGSGLFSLPINSLTPHAITGEFPRYSITRGGSHAGMDFGSSIGTPIFASQTGVVTRVNMGYDNNGYLGHPAGWANTVILRHNLPGQPEMYSIYAHLDNQQIVNVGDTLTQGQLLGYMGNSGSSTGPHLHFQIEVQGSTLNPIHEGKYHKYAPQNPREYLGNIEGNLTESQASTYCNFDGMGDTDFGGYPEVTLDQARQPILDYLNDNFEDSTIIENHNQGWQKDIAELKQENPDSWQDQIVIHQWCKIWVLDLQYLDQKPHFGNGDLAGGTGYDGQIMFNPYSKTPILIKNGIWDKYVDTNGPCGIVGVPKELEGKAGVPNDSRAINNKSWYQMFEKGTYTNNAIYAYNWRMNKYNLFEPMKYKAHFVVRDVANDYHNPNGGPGGTWSPYHFPLTDTYGTDRAIYCRQDFEGGGINKCFEGGIGIEEVIEVNAVNQGWNVEVDKVIPGVSKRQRNIKFEVISDNKNDIIDQWDGSKVWIVSHGWYRNPEIDEKVKKNYMRDLAEELVRQKPNDTVLLLDWREAAASTEEIGIGGITPTDVNRAAKWIKPVSIGGSTKLRDWGLSDNSKVNYVGHSLGTILSRELSNQLGTGGNGFMLDPASQLTPGASTEFFSFYDIDGNTSGVQSVQSIGGDSYFRSAFNYSRAFVGYKSVAGSKNLTRTAHQSVIFDYENIFDIGNEHFLVVETFINIISNRKFKNDFMDLDNLSNNGFIPNSEGDHAIVSGNNDSGINYDIRFQLKPDGQLIDYIYGTEGANDEINNFVVNNKNYQVYGHGIRTYYSLLGNSVNSGSQIMNFSKGQDTPNYSSLPDQIRLTEPNPNVIDYEIKNENGVPVIYYKSLFIKNPDGSPKVYRQSKVHGLSYQELKVDYSEFKKGNPSSFFVD